MAAVLAKRSPVAMAGVKQAIRLGLDADTLADGLEVERLLSERHRASKDVRIDVAAFASRTRPEFIGECTPPGHPGSDAGHRARPPAGAL